MKPWMTVLLIIMAILVVAFIVLYFLGKKMQKRQDESAELMKQNAQKISIFIIDKKKVKLKDAGFPAIVLESTPKYLRRSKVPVVQAKIGPRIMTLMCDGKIYEKLLPKQSGQATISGIYLTDFRRKHGPGYTPPKKKKRKLIGR